MEQLTGWAIDSHIHFDQYSIELRKSILGSLSDGKIKKLIAVSTNSVSAMEILRLSRKHQEIIPAIGFHPEQPLPTKNELEKIFNLIDTYETEWKAIGEVGLPYYTQLGNPNLNLQPYIELLEQFIIIAKQKRLPICLHIIYAHSHIAYNLLQKHDVKRAHFHWFKADHKTFQKIINAGYMVSFTPDILFKPQRRKLVKLTPIQQIMVETDGPWQYPEIINNSYTDPSLIHQVLSKIAIIKELPLDIVYEAVYQNTKNFFNV